MKKILLFILFPAISFSQIPAGYYDAASGLSGYALKSKLHDIISKKTVSYNYSDVATLYQTTDLDVYYDHNTSNNPYFDTATSTTKYILLDIYSEKPLSADAYEYDSTQNISSASAEGLGFNKEHGMPQSTFYGIYPMYSDIHYLIPADAYINQRRSNYPYARNNGETLTYTNGSKLGKSTTPGYTNTCYEPIDEFKGDVARYLLYFVVRYEGSLNHFNYLLSTSPLDGSEERAYEDWYITMLKDWNTLDPVSQREIDRNNAIYNIEKVRNPFIDHPEYVNMIWSETTDSVAPSAPASLTSTAYGESFVKLSWAPSPETDVLGYKIYVNGTYYGYSKTNSIYVDRLTANTSYNFTVKAYDKGYNLSADSNTYNVTTLATDTLAKDLMISKYIEGSSYNKAIEITNKTGHEVNLSNYYLNLQFKSTTYYFSDAFQLEGIMPANSVIVILHPSAAFPTYPVSNADFVTNSPALTFSGYNYVELSYGTKYLKTVSTNNYDMSYTTVDAVGIKDTSNSNGNISLYRNTDVTDPNVNFTISEWTTYAQNYAANLGVFATTTLATQDLASNSIFRIYPNPVSEGGKLYIAGTGSEKFATAEIYDMSGRMVYFENQPFQSKNYLEIDNLDSGVYILKVGSKSLRFIKK